MTERVDKLKIVIVVYHLQERQSELCVSDAEQINTTILLFKSKRCGRLQETQILVYLSLKPIFHLWYGRSRFC